MNSSTPPAGTNRLVRLQAFLAQDRKNPRLLADAAEAAYEAGDVGEASALLDRLAGRGPLAPEATNLAGLVAIADRRFKDAISLFQELLNGGQDDAGLRFNLAWSHAMLDQHEEANTLLGDDVLAAVPRAANLKVQMLHHLRRYDEARALGARLAPAYSNDQRLMGSLAMLALDAEDTVLARRYAEQARQDGQGLAALGTLALGEDNVRGAEDLFDAAIECEPTNPRAWIGKGLALLAEQRAQDAVPAIDRGATLFHDHIGSWIASGWAHFAADDPAGARASFDRALAIDPNFGETHGALAVLSIVSGHIDEAKRQTEIALRLDRGAFGGQLARLLLLQMAGDSSGAERIRQRALSMPIGTDGRTIGEALTRLAMRRG